MHDSHRWEDVSYHGSPDYQCDFCGIMDHNKAAKLPCKKAEECLKREAKDKEIREYNEYLSLKAQKDRWEYLKNKYER